jgi:hypothetical protein
MNPILTEAIIKHILSQFGVLPSPHIDLKKTKSLLDKDFLLSEKLSFQDEDSKMFKNNTWGCQLLLGQQEVKILLGDCSQDETKEYCLLVQSKDAPAYGLYLVLDEASEPLISVITNETDWFPCPTFLQATFLAAMEQIKDTHLNWSKCVDYRTQYDLMLSFIKHHNTVYEEE